MLFNSYSFIFLFLPIVLAGFYLIGKRNGYFASIWLTLASLFFYGWWNPEYVLLLIASIVFNFTIGFNIAKHTNSRKKLSKYWLIFGISSNILLLAYYKYTGFILTSYSELFNENTSIPDILLPLGISFFTFTQIAFLVDVSKGYVQEYKLAHYFLFVTYFPHLLAGPFLHHKEMMPQFSLTTPYKINEKDWVIGITIFFMGLFKKVVLADGVAQYVSAPFDMTATGAEISLLDAWGGALAYTFQLYFDFSGYSDMAIGISLLFGIKLPLNFNSPYKATSIIDFWRRWHITLSRFLRDYLYIPLGGSRRGAFRHYLNLLITMLLGGLWHGAGWGFIIWGGLHGLYLLINHGWRNSFIQSIMTYNCPLFFRQISALLLTFIATTVAWVFFRAENIKSATGMLDGMMGSHGIVLPYKYLNKLGNISNYLASQGVQFRDTRSFAGTEELLWILICFVIIWGTPNTQQILAKFTPALEMVDTKTENHWWEWKLTKTWLAIGMITAILSILSLSEVSEFIYFQF